MKKRIMLSGILFIIIIISVLVCFNKRERNVYSKDTAVNQAKSIMKLYL